MGALTESHHRSRRWLCYQDRASVRDEAQAEVLVLLTAALWPATPDPAGGVTPGERNGAPDARLAAAGALCDPWLEGQDWLTPNVRMLRDMDAMVVSVRAHRDEQGREGASRYSLRDGPWDRPSHATSGSNYPPKDA
jgi:hypothetical protein